MSNKIPMFWMKGGKIITDENNYPLNCKANPCGLYAILGFKKRPLNCETMNPYNQCVGDWTFQVIPFYIINGNVIYHQDCFQIEQHYGLVDHRKFKKDCSVNLQTNQKQCLTCYQVKVYNLGYSENYEDFKNIFYQPCYNDQQIEYPQIFDEYGLTLDAESCIQNYWQTYFQQNYSLNFKFRWQIRGQCWYEQVWYEDITYRHEVIAKYCWSDLYDDYCEGGDYDGDQLISCPSGCRLVQIGYDVDVGINWIGHICYMLGHSSQETHEHYYYEPVFDEYIQLPIEQPFGCIEEQQVYGDGMNTVNDYIMDLASTKQLYGIYPSNAPYYGAKGTGQSNQDCTYDDRLCFQFEYNSGPFDNFYESTTMLYSLFRWARFRVQRTSHTPQTAKGIKFKMILTHIKTNTGHGNESSSSTTTSSSVQCMFDQINNNEVEIQSSSSSSDSSSSLQSNNTIWYEDLPLATDITLWRLIKNIVCDSNQPKQCDGSVPYSCQLFVEPMMNGQTHYDQNIKSEKYHVKLIAQEYIY